MKCYTISSNQTYLLQEKVKAFTGYLQIAFPPTPVHKYVCVCMCIFIYTRKVMFSFYKITITDLGNFGAGND